MHVRRKLSLFYLLSWNIKPAILMTAWATFVACVNHYIPWISFDLPWLPMSVIGTAVAFYLGFKNNASYERLWEARKIWGSIVNDSRSFAAYVREYISAEFGSTKPDSELDSLRKSMIYRHIAWLYQLKRQLRVLKDWEHHNGRVKSVRNHIAERFPLVDQKSELQRYLREQEYDRLANKANMATQILAEQSKQAVQLKKEGLIDEFRLMDLMKMISRFYDSQGKCERIKNYPFPRQYASFSYYLAVLFITLVPLGMADAFTNFHGGDHFYLMIPLSLLIGLVFWFMEIIGDYAENPFEGIKSDIPMDNLVRTIEIDLREMLDDEQVPARIEPVDGFVM